MPSSCRTTRWRPTPGWHSAPPRLTHVRVARPRHPSGDVLGKAFLGHQSTAQPLPPVGSAGFPRFPPAPPFTADRWALSAGPRSVTTHLKTRLTQRRRRPGVLRSRERRLHLATRARIRAKVQLLRGRWEYNASVASFTVEARKDLAATLMDRCRIYIDINIYMKHLPRNVKDQNKLKFCLRR